MDPRIKEAGVKQWWGRLRDQQGPGLGRDGVPTQAELDRIRPHLDDKEYARLQALVDRHERQKHAAEVDAMLQGAAPPEAPPEAPADPQAEVDQYLQPPAPPPPSLVDALKQLAARKYAVLLAYLAFADQLRCVERDGLKAHFDEHLAEERAWLYAIHRMVAARGDACYPMGVAVPTVPLLAPRPAIEALAAMEQDLLAAWAEATQVASTDPALATGEREAVVAQLQEGARVDLAHLEDLRRYLGSAA